MASLNGSGYLMRIKVQEELDKLVITHIQLTEKEYGNICGVCSIIQGKPLNGFEKYYCQHLTDRIDRKLKKEKENISIKILRLTSQDAGTIS